MTSTCTWEQYRTRLNVLPVKEKPVIHTHAEMKTYMGVPKKMSESHWGTYFIWPFRCSGFFGGSRISSKMVSLHLPGEKRLFGKGSNRRAGYGLKAERLACRQGLSPVTVWKASSSMSSPPELAELLYWARALLYSWSLPFISSTALGSGEGGGAWGEDG